VLNPPDPPLAATDSDVDNNAAVLRLSLGEVSFLLTADIMWRAEFELAYSRANLRSTVLKVAHHGSNTSTTPEFLAVAHPEIAVISVGADNKYGHPTEEVLERLEDLVGEENIYRTDENGTVEFITDGERLWLETGR
jgi:competence protein ComEC